MTPTVAEDVQSFRHIHLDQVDPSFQPIDENYYNLRITSAELKEFTYKNGEKAGQTDERINLGLTVVNDPKFSGRRLYESLFPNGFSFRVMRRIQDATGIPQNGETESWLKELAAIGPVVKLKVIQVPDVLRDGTPNPKTVLASGDAAPKNVIDWKSGVQPGD